MRQVISINPSNLSAAANSPVSFDVIYSTADPVDETLTGIGLRLHFNSDELTFKDLSNVFQTNFTAQQVQDDTTSNFDNDDSTDKFILAGWLDFTSGAWPGDNNTPTTLYTANFTTSADFTSTTINFTESTTAAGYELDAPSIAIQETDSPPTVANLIPSQTVDEDSDPITIDLSSVFDDVNNDNAAITKAVTDNTNENLVTTALNGNDLTLTFEPDANGEAVITVEATSNGLKVEDKFKVTVNSVDDPPVIDKSNLTFSVDENSAVDVEVGTVAATDPDEDKSLSFTLVNDSNLDSDGDGTRAFAINQDGVITVADRDELDFETKPIFDLEVTATDTSGLKDTASVTVNLTNIDDAPTVANLIPSQTVDEDSDPITIDLSNVFNDVDNSNAAITKAVTDNTNENLVTTTLNGNDLTLAFEPNANGEAIITVEATSNGLKVEDKFKVTVNSVTDGLLLQDSKIFNFDSNSNLAFSLENSVDVSQVNEIGIFLFDDATGKIGNFSPGDSGYGLAALERSQPLFSVLADNPQGFDANIKQILDVEDLFTNSGSPLFGLYLTPEHTPSSNDSEIEEGKIFLSNVEDNVTITGNPTGSFTLDWKEPGKGDSAAFGDVPVIVELTNETSSLGTDRLLDLSDRTENVSVNMTLTREADFNNVVVWYEIDDLTGAVTDANGNKIEATADNREDYIAAAKANIHQDTNFTVADDAVATTPNVIELEAGKIYAPMLLVESEDNPTEVYTAFANVNADGKNRILSLGDNIIGFEDHTDFDFNDMVMEFELV
ncbi:MAG: hypothetical protein Tsb0014_43330 [Pleurocapsa sp.]